MEPKGSLPRSRRPDTCPYQQSDQFSACPFILFKICFNVILPFTTRRKSAEQFILNLFIIPSENRETSTRYAPAFVLLNIKYVWNTNLYKQIGRKAVIGKTMTLRPILPAWIVSPGTRSSDYTPEQVLRGHIEAMGRNWNYTVHRKPVIEKKYIISVLILTKQIYALAPKNCVSY
jgi:hypothetical protein